MFFPIIGRWFWKAVLPALRRGQIDAALSMGVVGHHLIRFSREALRGEQNASFYSAKGRSEAADGGRRHSRTAPARDASLCCGCNVIDHKA